MAITKPPNVLHYGVQTLCVGRPGLLMGDFNMCVDASPSTSERSIMDDPEQIAWVSLVMEVPKPDVWMWLHGMI